jgi:CheY-like chemotaxis protein
VKFTSEGKIVVQTSATTRPDGAALVRIEVVDTGIGIEPARIETMFEPFTQADVSTTRNYGGTGLGLAIARELTLLMGGKIGAESKPGAGSTFWIELPLLASTGPSRQDLARPATDPRPEWLAPPRVLVVEDSPINQIVAVRTLEHCGCRADVAGDGLQALEALSAHEYDAILMDCQMPVMDGFDATIELRRRENGGRRTPVIAMTANATANAVAECLAAGMDDYVGKPVRREQLLAALCRWVGPQVVALASNAARAARS